MNAFMSFEACPKDSPQNGQATSSLLTTNNSFFTQDSFPQRKNSHDSQAPSDDSSQDNQDPHCNNFEVRFIDNITNIPVSNTRNDDSANHHHFLASSPNSTSIMKSYQSLSTNSEANSDIFDHSRQKLPEQKTQAPALHTIQETGNSSNGLTSPDSFQARLSYDQSCSLYDGSDRLTIKQSCSTTPSTFRTQFMPPLYGNNKQSQLQKSSFLPLASKSDTLLAKNSDLLSSFKDSPAKLLPKLNTNGSSLLKMPVDKSNQFSSPQKVPQKLNSFLPMRSCSMNTIPSQINEPKSGLFNPFSTSSTFNPLKKAPTFDYEDYEKSEGDFEDKVFNFNSQDTTNLTMKSTEMDDSYVCQKLGLRSSHDPCKSALHKPQDDSCDDDSSDDEIEFPKPSSNPTYNHPLRPPAFAPLSKKFASEHSIRTPTSAFRRVLDFTEESRKVDFSQPNQCVSATLKSYNPFSEYNNVPNNSLLNNQQKKASGYAIERFRSENLMSRGDQNKSEAATSENGKLNRSEENGNNSESSDDASVAGKEFQEEVQNEGGAGHPSLLKVEKNLSSPDSNFHQRKLNNQFANMKSFKSSTDINFRNTGRAHTFSPNVGRSQPETTRFEKDFQVEETLGNGSLTSVYKCENIHDKQKYAVKLTHNKLKVPENRVRNALNRLQADTSSSDMEPNYYTVRYFNSWVEDGKLCIVMEYCEGSLRDLKFQRSEDEIKSILRDICQALKPLHQKQIVHGHIKPENILSKSNKYKLGDLGLADLGFEIKKDSEEEFGSNTYEAILEDAMFYFSPEMNDYPSENPHPSKCDMFSLGLVIAECMMNINFRDHKNIRDELKEGKFEKLDALNYSEKLKKAVKSLLDKQQDKRPSAEELLAAFPVIDPANELRALKDENKSMRKKIEDLNKQLGLRSRKNSM